MTSPFLNTDSVPFCSVWQAGVNAVTAGNDAIQGGWVSGNPASLAASGVVDVLWDLGPMWRRINLVQVCMSPAGPSSGVTVGSYSSDTSTINTDRKLNYATAISAGGGQATVNGGTAQSWNVKPMGRYFFARVTNADGANPQGAAATITIATYPS